MKFTSGWRQLYCKPRICRGAEPFSPKQKYYYEKSLQRYKQTPDGKYFEEAAKRLSENQEIGRIESVRFIVSPNLPNESAEL